MKVLVRFADGLAVAMMVLGGVALFALLFHIVLDVFLKAVFNQPIPATLEIVSYYYMVAIAFLPVAYVQKNREHISVDLFTMGFGARGLALIDAIVSVITIAYTATLTWLVYGKAVKAFSKGEMQDVVFFELPIWPARWMLPFAFGAMCLVLLYQAIIDFRYAATGQGKPTHVRDDAHKVAET